MRTRITAVALAAGSGITTLAGFAIGAPPALANEDTHFVGVQSGAEARSAISESGYWECPYRRPPPQYDPVDGRPSYFGVTIDIGGSLERIICAVF